MPIDQLTYGSFYFSTPILTPLAAVTPAKALGVTTPLIFNGFTVSASNRMTLDAGQTTRDYEVTLSVSMTKAGGGATLGHLHVAKNGAIVPGAHIHRSLANTSDEGAVSLNFQLELAAGDYIEVWIETTNGDDMTIETGTMTVKVIG